MYTICWTDADGVDHYERCKNRKEVADLLYRNGIEWDPEILIFGPDADDYLIDAEDILNDE